VEDRHPRPSSGPTTLRGRDFIHRIPRAPVVDRIEQLMKVARGRRVIDVGFVDVGLMAAKTDQGTWLHRRLSEVAAELVGIDIDEAGVRVARRMGFEAHVADCQEAEALARLHLKPADIVVAGELIEHLDRPGDFLQAIRCLTGSSGLLALSTPNAMALTNFVVSVFRREIVNPDHVAWYSRQTILTLLARHGWSPEGFAYYALPNQNTNPDLRVTEQFLVRTWNACRMPMRGIYGFWPSLADGMVILALPGQKVPAGSHRGISA